MRKSHPNWKIQVLLRHAIIVSKDAIFLGRSLSCDEDTMGCKGRHPDILRINYKKKVMGFSAMHWDLMAILTHFYSVINLPHSATLIKICVRYMQGLWHF